MDTNTPDGHGKGKDGGALDTLAAALTPAWEKYAKRIGQGTANMKFVRWLAVNITPELMQAAADGAPYIWAGLAKNIPDAFLSFGLGGGTADAVRGASIKFLEGFSEGLRGKPLTVEHIDTAVEKGLEAFENFFDQPMHLGADRVNISFHYPVCPNGRPNKGGKNPTLRECMAHPVWVVGNCCQPMLQVDVAKEKSKDGETSKTLFPEFTIPPGISNVHLLGLIHREWPDGHETIFSWLNWLCVERPDDYTKVWELFHEIDTCDEVIGLVDIIRRDRERAIDMMQELTAHRDRAMTNIDSSLDKLGKKVRTYWDGVWSAIETGWNGLEKQVGKIDKKIAPAKKRRELKEEIAALDAKFAEDQAERAVKRDKRKNRGFFAKLLS